MARISRRSVLSLIGVGGVLAVSPYLAGQRATGKELPSEVTLPDPYRVPLTVPREATGTRSGGTITYDLVQRPADVELLPGVRTPMLTYDGSFPGPTLRSRSGETTIVRHRNELTVPTATHLHGGHTPPDSDGFPTDLLLPTGGGEPGHQHHDPAAVVRTGSREYRYPMRQPAATLWYHDHSMAGTATNIWRGLAGFHLVTDDVEEALALPHGDRDLPLMISDRSFRADGLHTGRHTAGVLGDVILVNSTPWPFLETAGARYRLRLLNASGARRYRLALDPPPPGGKGFVQVGSDRGLLAAPLTRDTVTLSPAERCDVVVDFGRYRPGTTVELVNQLGSGGTARVMRFHVGDRVADDSAVPTRLADVERLEPGPHARERSFVFQARDDAWAVNGQPFDPTRTDADPRLGDIEIWRFASDVDHPVHVHLSPFQVLQRGTDGPGPDDHGWKDTVDVRAGEIVTVAVRFTDYTGRYVLHCHNLEHEDRSMMATIMIRS
jgi:spore coat protein A